MKLLARLGRKGSTATTTTAETATTLTAAQHAQQHKLTSFAHLLDDKFDVTRDVLLEFAAGHDAHAQILFLFVEKVLHAALALSSTVHQFTAKSAV